MSVLVDSVNDIKEAESLLFKACQEYVKASEGSLTPQQVQIVKDKLVGFCKATAAKARAHTQVRPAEAPLEELDTDLQARVEALEQKVVEEAARVRQLRESAKQRAEAKAEANRARVAAAVEGKGGEEAAEKEEEKGEELRVSAEDVQGVQALQTQLAGAVASLDAELSKHLASAGDLATYLKSREEVLPLSSSSSSSDGQQASSGYGKTQKERVAAGLRQKMY